MKDKKVVLITGCSTGIGRELCKILFDKGYIVAASARKLEDLEGLTASLKVALDVTQKESVTASVNEVISRFQKIDMLINNAGYSMRGALEEIDVNRAKQMFDVNVFGIINMIQAVLPEMRRRKYGRIINIGSISGKFVQPINGVYCASKFAVEALSDALRLELHSHNIETTVIEPGPIETHFFKTLANQSDQLLSNTNSCYTGFYKSDMSFRSRQKRTGVKEAAEIIVDIILKKRLKARYKVAVPFIFRMIVRFPDAFKEYLMKKR